MSGDRRSHAGVWLIAPDPLPEDVFSHLPEADDVETLVNTPAVGDEVDKKKVGDDTDIDLSVGASITKNASHQGSGKADNEGVSIEQDVLDGIKALVYHDTVVRTKVQDIITSGEGFVHMSTVEEALCKQMGIDKQALCALQDDAANVVNSLTLSEHMRSIILQIGDESNKLCNHVDKVTVMDPPEIFKLLKLIIALKQKLTNCTDTYVRHLIDQSYETTDGTSTIDFLIEYYTKHGNIQLV